MNARRVPEFCGPTTQATNKAAPAGEMPGAAAPEVCHDRTAPAP